MPGSLITWLAANPNALRADCFAIALPTGNVLYVTSGQWDITLLTTTPGWGNAQTTFKATQYGRWTRGDITSEAGFRCQANDMDLTAVVQPNTTYPGLPTLGLLSAALNHLFDGATVWVYTAYMPLGFYGTVQGVVTQWQGTIGKWDPLDRLSVKFTCSDPFYLLNQKVPGRLFQANCPWSFADVKCSLTASNYTKVFTATSSSLTQSTLTGTALTMPNGYFTQGVITCLTGLNAGLAQTVKAYTSGLITTMQPWLMPVAAGDTFSVIKGCDKTPTTCAATAHTDGTAESQDYAIRFGGDPFIPPPSTAI
jgi:hypothetical protein